MNGTVSSAAALVGLGVGAAVAGYVWVAEDFREMITTRMDRDRWPWLPWSIAYGWGLVAVCVALVGLARAVRGLCGTSR